jgi:hypothetical protein
VKLTHKTIGPAIEKAKKLAAEGPRVSAILKSNLRYGAVPGYLDADTGSIEQVALVTPDGRVWKRTVTPHEMT